MAIRPAGSLKARMCCSETTAQLSRPRLSKCFIRSPAAGCKALGGLKHFEPVHGRPQMLLAPERDVGLHRRTESVDMTIGVFEGKYVVTLGERVEVRVIL